MNSLVSSPAGGPDSGRLDASDIGPRLVAGVAALLQRYTDRTEIVVGYQPVGDENPRPLVIDLAGGPSFTELMARVSDVVASVEVGEHDGIADADAIVALGQDPPAASRHPRWLAAHQGEDGVELVMHGGETPSSGSDDPLAGQVCALLASAAAEPDTPVTALPVLTASERHQLLVRFNDTGATYPRACLHELVSERALAAPHSIAVVSGHEQLTYAQLDQRSSQLAHRLVDMGAGPEILVGICVERSLEMVIGLLGILKAGAAYVPIDPAYPGERQEYMLTNSRAPVIVTQERLRERLPASDASVVCLDRDWPMIATLPTTAPEVPADPEQLAYVIYTSGSTGLPKGVQIPHRALVNFLVTMAQRPGLEAADVLAAVTTLSFDIAGLELYLPLMIGARVVIAPGETTGDARALGELLDHSGATVMQATPTTWRMLVDSGWKPSRRMKALCGGEALPVALADRLVALDLELWNMYGPTETTIWSTCAPVQTTGEPLSIGRPIANTTLWILNGDMQPAPVGAAGELWIGGDGLARGYRERPDLTEERFVANPLDPAGARIYRTGDLARYRPDGSVDFLGRIDHQVKVRGFRIELGEIETVLARHPGVAEAVVVARGSEAEAELAAYVLPIGATVAAHELRRFLAQTVPAYMVPSTVTTLDAFPLTPNGKVDRKALPEPTRERSGERELVAARTPLERRLAEIWERVLDISPIGMTDNFFDLGVTSIVAASLFAAIEHDLGDSLPLGAIFRAPTIEALANLIEAGDGSARWTSLVPIQPQGSQVPIFCVHGGAGTILHLEPLARRLGTDQPFYGLQSSGLYGGSVPLRTVEEMATHYLSEMRQVQPEGPWRLAGYCFGTIVAFELAQRLLANGEQVQMLTMFNGPSPSWIRRWGWYGNQPSRRHLRPRPAPRVTRGQRLRRALREPRRFGTAFAYYARKELDQRKGRYALAHRRPLPERFREQYFLDLHFTAERAYQPSPYPGDLLVFYGEGLYEQPDLGWAEFTTGCVTTYAVHGENNNNRDVMREPNVEFVSERIRDYLQGRLPQPAPLASA